MLTLWPEFLKQLEAAAHIECGSTAISPDARAQRAGNVIQNRDGREGFLEAIKACLKNGSGEIPQSTASLAEIHWPLTISTNYDDLFYYACRQKFGADVQVLGRSPLDCKLVYSSLTGPFDGQYIWHVQGFLGGQYPGADPNQDVPGIEDLKSQLVTGHAEYRKVANRAPDFRRCFSEVFNSRSFLFLGSSLREDYFLNLFGEVLDLCGPSPVPHFAFTEAGQVDADFLSDQMNITVCEFPKKQWDELPRWLDRLKCEIEKPRSRSVGWSYAMASSPEETPDLKIVAGLAPPPRNEREATAFVARRESGLPVPPPHLLALADSPQPTGSHHVFSYPASRLYAGTAHCDGSADNDSMVAAATKDLLDIVARQNPLVTTLHFQFSATGGTVPPIYAFVEAVRMFGAWRQERAVFGESPLRLIGYVPSAVELCLTSGRIDIRELLASRLIRYWVMVVSAKGQEPVRRSMHSCPHACLSDVLRAVGVPADSAQWFASVRPSPRKTILKRPVCDLSTLELVQMGVAFGSVLVLEYDAKAGKEVANTAVAGQ